MMIWVALWFFLILWIYSPALPGPVRIHDDQSSIIEMRPYYERRYGPWLKGTKRPVYHWLNYRTWKRFGFYPPVWHLGNMMLHWLACCVLYAVTLRFRWPHPEWIVTGFVAHPLSTASVAYVTGRSGIIAAVFLFLGAVVYLWPFPFCLLAPIPFCMAYVSREDSIVVLAWLPFLEMYR